MAPASTGYDASNEYYKSEREYVFAIAEALRQEYLEIVNSGLILQVDDAVLATLPAIRLAGGRLDLSGTGLTAPSSTWTYLVNDDPFKSRIGALLTGPGGATIAIYAAAVMMPLLVLWGLVDRLLGRRTTRRANPFDSSRGPS